MFPCSATDAGDDGRSRRICDTVFPITMLTSGGSMSFPRFLLRTIVMAIAWFALGYVGHQLLLGRDYVAIEPIMRTKADMRAHLIFTPLSGLILAALVWFYAQGRSAKPWL